MLLKLEAERAKAEAEKMIARDNLKIKTMAKYKAIKIKHMQAFLDIEQEIPDLAYCKGKAFSDSSVEEMERAIESNLEARGLNDSEHNYGKRSDNSEMQASLDSD